MSPDGGDEWSYRPPPVAAPARARPRPDRPHRRRRRRTGGGARHRGDRGGRPGSVPTTVRHGRAAADLHPRGRHAHVHHFAAVRLARRRRRGRGQPLQLSRAHQPHGRPAMSPATRGCRCSPRAAKQIGRPPPATAWRTHPSSSSPAVREHHHPHRQPAGGVPGDVGPAEDLPAGQQRLAGDPGPDHRLRQPVQITPFTAGRPGIPPADARPPDLPGAAAAGRSGAPGKAVRQGSMR